MQKRKKISQRYRGRLGKQDSKERKDSRKMVRDRSGDRGRGGDDGERTVTWAA